VAISTTGEEHRLDLLRQCVAGWDRCLSKGSVLFITVDGTVRDTQRVSDAVFGTGDIYRVGQPLRYQFGTGEPIMDESHLRLGVAANKNTGIELLMGAGVEHLFLSDDDTWPLYLESLTKHTDLPMHHSMVCWGRHRLVKSETPMSFATWHWPRGVMLHMRRSVIETIGGMDERFGIGGHEHVEYSQRIHNAGLTPAPFITPASYATRMGMGAAALWHAEDMPRLGEKLGDHRLRRRNLTTINNTAEQWARVEQVMAERAGSADFVDYHAAANGRGSATLCEYTPSQGAGEA